MPKFEDRNNQPPMLETGDYQFEVIGLDKGISQGEKTRQSDQYEIKLRVGPGNTIYETLIDHETTAWKLDTFLKCCNVKLPVGAFWEFGKSDTIRNMSDGTQVHVINPIGLRGWCHVVIEEWVPKNQTIAKKRNRIGTFYTDKEKLPKRPQAAVAPAEPEPF